MKKIIFVLWIVFVETGLAFSQNKLDINKLQLEIHQGIQRAYQASVAIVEFDTVSNTSGAAFSGVAVNAAGHILSAAHAVKPGKVYQVTFPNGQTFRAKGLGSINHKDAAMLQITEKGQWPFTEMGRSAALKPFVPCLSISYPGSTIMYTKKPTIRFGYVVSLPQNQDFTPLNLIRTTCLMEPGDSGGGVFDLHGRVIGIHSQIQMSLQDNFEVPVDVFLQNWDLLLKPKAYSRKNIPVTDTTTSTVNPLPSYPALADIAKLAIPKKGADNTGLITFSLNSTRKGKKVTSWATLVNLKGVVTKKSTVGNCYLVTKSSLLGDNPELVLPKGAVIQARVLKRDKNTDLALLEVGKTLKGGIKLYPSAADTIAFSDIGNFLRSPGPDGKAIVSVLGDGPIAIFPIVGLMVDDMGKHPKVLVQDTISAIREAALQKNDEILTINGIAVRRKKEIQKAVFDVPDDSIAISFSRNGKVIDKKVALLRMKSIFKSNFHVADFFEGGKSERRDGFSSVLVHDGPLYPQYCGGPLLGLDGRFYGINIARLSRTSSLAIPALEVINFIRTAFEPK